MAGGMRSPLALARRIAAMSFDEIRTRAQMAVRKRLDLWEAQRGRNPLQARDAIARNPAPRFCFDQGEAPLLAAEVRRRLPSDWESVIDSAKRVQQRRFDLLGYRNLSFGDSDTSWQFDPVNKINSPIAPWFRVPYLDFHRSGDHKIVWELSRHQHLMLLGRAWLYAGDQQFLVTLQNLWLGWRQANPYPTGINWASTLEVAFRCLSWIWVDHFTAGAEALARDFRSRLHAGIGECAVYIERYLSTYFAPNTHLLGEALALFFVGVLYPQLERATIWRDHGWKILLQESARQVREDGFHFEQSVYYHVYALDMFLHARILASRNNIAIPELYDRTIQLMAEGLATLGMAGQAPRFGDDDGGRLFDNRRNRPEHLLDPLATAAILYRRNDWKAIAGGLREETVWLLGSGGVRSFDELPAARPELRSVEFASSGYYTMASSDAVVIADAGPHGWGNGGHGHADALSLQLISRGRAWLTDPGTATYTREKRERDQFRGTAAHNTLEVDGVSQADPVHAFAWGRHPVTKIHRWYPGRDVVLFHASHDGYQRLPSPVVHERWVIGWRDDAWLVVDRASGKGAHRLDLRWHLSPECIAQPTDSVSVSRYALDNQTLDIIAPAGTSWHIASETGNWSPAYGAVTPAPVLHFCTEGPLPRDFATLLALNHPGRVSLRNVSGDGVEMYLCEFGESQRLVAVATGVASWRLGPIQCSAELLLIEYSGNRICRLLVSGSSQLTIAGEPPSLIGVSAGVWEARTKEETLLLSPAAAKALLQAWERLWAPGPSAVFSAPQESGCNP
jgi:hypothetical protein